jgi:hypothetical protein
MVGDILQKYKNLMKQLVIWLKEMVTRIRVVFSSKRTPAITPDQLILKPQRIKQIMQLPEMQKLKNQMIIDQGEEFLELVAIQYLQPDLDISQRMILGLAMHRTLTQINRSKKLMKTN